jgi:hypothetical protein
MAVNEPGVDTGVRRHVLYPAEDDVTAANVIWVCVA